MKSFKGLRIILHIFAGVAILTGFLGFLISMGDAYSSIEKFDIQTPLHNVNGVAVDSQGCIYYGTMQHSAIQVYNNYGEYIYSFSFPTGGAGYFSFYIDKDDYVHIATARQNCTYSFLYGDLIDSTDYADAKEKSDTIREYSNKSEVFSFTDKDGNIYIVNGNKKIAMYDSDSNFIRTIYPNAPRWPLSLMEFWSIAASGVVLLILLNRRIFLKLLKKSF